MSRRRKPIESGPDPDRPNGTPWEKICLQAVRGRPLANLARSYGVAVDEIQMHLNPEHKYLLASERTFQRTAAELTRASRQARDDLITFLQNAISELLADQRPSEELMPQFATLTACASKLFAWQSTVKHQWTSEADPNSAVNLALIATPPEKLAQLAIDRGLLPAATEPIADPRPNGTKDLTPP